MPVLIELISLPAAQGCHVSWLGLPLRLPAAFLFDWVGVTGLAA